MTVDIEFNCKYAALRCVLEHSSDALCSILKEVSLSLEPKYVSVDIKHQRLSDNTKYTCIPGWHSDTKNDPNAIHHIWVSGENRTEFLLPDKSIWKLPNETWYSYGQDLHRGPRVKVSETRLLIRLTESRKIKPNRKLEWI